MASKKTPRKRLIDIENPKVGITERKDRLSSEDARCLAMRLLERRMRRR